MSDEQQQEKQEKKCNCKAIAIVAIAALVFSIASLAISIITLNGGSIGVSAPQEGKKVVISKQYDKGQSFEKAQQTGKPIIVFFYTDWCGFCQRFAPTFAKVTKDKKIKNNFAVAYVNCEKPENQALMQEYDVHGFPTVFVIKDGEKTQLENNTFFNPDSVQVLKENIMGMAE